MLLSVDLQLLSLQTDHGEPGLMVCRHLRSHLSHECSGAHPPQGAPGRRGGCGQTGPPQRGLGSGGSVLGHWVRLRSGVILGTLARELQGLRMVEPQAPLTT